MYFPFHSSGISIYKNRPCQKGLRHILFYKLLQCIQRNIYKNRPCQKGLRPSADNRTAKANSSPYLQKPTLLERIETFSQLIKSLNIELKRNIYKNRPCQKGLRQKNIRNQRIFCAIFPIYKNRPCQKGLRHKRLNTREIFSIIIYKNRPCQKGLRLVPTTRVSV